MLPEQEFKKALREYLKNDIPDEIKKTVEVLEMMLASPGDWELAKVELDEEPEIEKLDDEESDDDKESDDSEDKTED